MPGANLTRVEAESRSAILLVDSYEVSLDLTTGDKTFEQDTTVRFRCTKPGSSTFIDAVVDSFHSVTLNGQEIDMAGYDGSSIPLSNLAEENVLHVRATTRYVNTGEGLHRFVDPADGEVYLYTQFEPNDAQRMFACFDQPDLKATFTFSVNAPSEWEVISNSPVASRVAGVTTGTTWNFAPTPRISTYITALVAGPYHYVHDVHDGKEKQIPLGLYCRKSLAPFLDADNIFEVTKQGFTFFEEEFGLAYPFEKYDQLAVPEFNAGAMENSGCVTFAEDYFVFRSKVTDRSYNWRANTILHEMAHMWFGDLVTMQWWDDLWLNESFAEWASYLALGRATRFTNAQTVFSAERKNWAYRQDQLSSTHPIVGEVPDLMAARTNLDGITYAKGASALQVLSNYCGEKEFLAGLRIYFAKHAWGNARLNDLLSEISKASGRDLTSWAASWLQTAGVNTLRPEVVIDGDTYASVAIKQEPPRIPVGSADLRPHRFAIGLYDLKNDALVLRKREVVDMDGERIDVPALAGEKVADLMLLNDGDMTYAKIRFDERSVETLIGNLGAMKDSLNRALCWSAAWDMLRDGELPASEYVPMVLNALESEDDVAVVQNTLGQLETAVELYASPAKRDALRRQVGGKLSALVDSAEAGSDHQLAFVRSLAAFASTDSEFAQLESIYKGTKVPSGLAVDQELRWHLLLALTAAGKAGNAEIESELASDNTANGKKSATSCRAAIPTLEAKEDAFAMILTGEVPNLIQRSAVTGFRRAAHRDLLANFIDRYFASVAERWNALSYEIGSQMVNGLFPAYNVSQDVLDKTDAWLQANNDAPGALLRFVNENRDSLARALKAQQRDS